MSDRASYIEAGVKYSWMVKYDTGEIETEFSRNGFITKLSQIDWDRVQEFCAYDIRDISEEPTPILKFTFHKGCTPIWFHRSVGYVGHREYITIEVTITFLGVETEEYKHYACFEADGSTRILFEKKG